METPRNLELEATAFANPEDLDSWRVYADWLLSVGDPRGELISLDLRSREGFASERARIRERVAEARQPFVDRFHAWAQERDLMEVHPKFDARGFVETLSASLSQLGPHLAELVAREPIQRLILEDAEGSMLLELCQAHPRWAAGLRYLKISGGIGPLGAAALAELELPALQRLNLLGNELDAEACTHLAGLATEQLHALTLTLNEIDAAGVSALLEAPSRGQWRELYLASNPLDAEGVTALAGATKMGQLERLFLKDTEAGFDDYARLLDAFPKLQILELSGYGSWRARDTLAAMRERLGKGLRLI